MLDAAIALICRCAPEITSGAVFLIRRKYPDISVFEDMLRRLQLVDRIDPAQRSLLEELVDFDQMRRDFEAALLICVAGYCLLMTLTPARSCAVGVLVWVVGWTVARCCFHYGDNESRIRRYRVIVILFIVVEICSVAAKAVM